MNKRKPTFLKPVNRIIIIVVCAIFFIFFCFIYMQYQTRHSEYEDKLIINTFGKQRMYTQMISKDVSRLYALMQVRDTDYAYRSDDEIQKKIVGVKDSLLLARASFSDILQALHKKEIYINGDLISIDPTLVESSEYLKEIDELWVNFNKAISVMIAAEEIDDNMAEAAIYINENNMELLYRCDNLLNQIQEASLQKDRTILYISFGLIGLLSLVIMVSLYQLYHYLLQPFGQLYRGLAEIGLSTIPVQTNFPTQKKIVPIVTEINDMFLKINSLITVIESINSNDSFMETLNYIRDTFSPFIPYNYIGIALISEDKKYLKATYGVSDGTIIGLPEKIRGASWLISDTSMGELIQTGEVRIINDLEEYCNGKPIKTYNKVILDAGIKSSITLPLMISGEPMGMIFFSSSNRNVYTVEHINFLRTLANSIAICLNQNILISDIVYSSILALAKLAEARDEDTGEHLERMSIYSRVIAELLYENNIYTDEITLEYIDNIERFSPLHDIGKVGIRDGILLKPAKLTMEEFEEMKHHASFGEEVLRTAEHNLQKRSRSLFHMGAEIAGGHHEKWDGSGYPLGRKGLEIPLCARIVSVADVFDALTSKRPYKDAFPLEKAMNIIEEGRGKHFDPVIIDVVLNNRNKIENIYYKFKSTNKPD